MNYNDEEEVMRRVKEIQDKLVNAETDESISNEQATQLMFEQMLRGLYLTGQYSW